MTDKDALPEDHLRSLREARAEIERLREENEQLRQANVDWARRNLLEVRDEVRTALEQKP